MGSFFDVTNTLPRDLRATFFGPDTQSSHQFFMPMSGRTARFIWPELQSQYIEYTGKKIQNEQRERCILLQQQPAQTEIMSLKSRLRDEMCLANERTQRLELGRVIDS